MNQKYKNIRLLLAILLMIALLGYLIIDMIGILDPTDNRLGGKSETDNFVLVEYLIDKDNVYSTKFGSHLEKVCNYAKFPYQETEIANWNNVDQILSSTRVISIQNTHKLSDQAVHRLLEFVVRGGTLFLPNTCEDKRFAYLLGLVENPTFEMDYSAKGTIFNTVFLPNFKGKTSDEEFIHDGLSKENFSEKVKIHANAINDKDFPVIIENNIGKGNVIYFNSAFGLEKRERGLIFSSILKGLEGIPYPVANVSTIFLDDFPSPLYNIKKEPIAEEMDLSISDFVLNVWWPDMEHLGDSLKINYSAYTTFDYRNKDLPPFLFDQWDSNIITRNNKRWSTSNWLAQDLLKKGHELAFHGYNHNSLVKEEWSNPVFMGISLNTAKKKWEIDKLGKLPVSYVPPSNYIDSLGVNQLFESMPSIKYISSTYLGDYYNGGDREFDTEGWNNHFFNYPRITSGYELNEESQFLHQSLYLYTGIWTHFVHPDDVYQIPENQDKSQGDFELRNGSNLGWHRSKRNNKGMLSIFKDYLVEIKTLFPLTRFLNATAASELTKHWRETKFIHKILENKYIVEATAFEDKAPKSNYWFMYGSKDNSISIEDVLKTQAEEFKKTPYLDGYLFSIRTKKPSLLVPEDIIYYNNQFILSTLESKVINDYNKYIEKGIELQKEMLIFEEQPVKYIGPTKNSSFKEWMFYYIETGMLSQATDLLKSKIDNEVQLDTSLWNSYYSYMAWQERETEVWNLLETRVDKKLALENVMYAGYLGKKYGYLNEASKIKWLSLQSKYTDDPEILKEYITVINHQENQEKVKHVLKRITEIEPGFANDLNYLSFLIQFEPDTAIAELNSYIPSESSSIWSLATEISWLYANNKRYKKAYDWAKFSNDIAFTNKMYWLLEIKDFDTLEKEYAQYIVKNPNDNKAKLLMGQMLMSNDKLKEAWILTTSLPSTMEKDTLKKSLNEGVKYVKRITQKELINKYDDLFEEKVKNEIVKEIRLAEGNTLEFKSQIIGDNISKTAFERKLSFGMYDKKENGHIFSVKNSDYFKIDQSSSADSDNFNTNVTGLEYMFKNPKSYDSIQYFIKGGIEKSQKNEIYYNGAIGASISKEKAYKSAGLEVAPVKTGPAYEKMIYRAQASVYQENKINKIFITTVYLEGNLYSDETVEGSITGKVNLDNGKDKKVKISPFIEASYSKSNAKEPKDYPYWVVPKRLFTGAGVGIKLGKENSDVNVRVEGATFLDKDLGNFNRLNGSASYKIGNFTEVTGQVELSTQSQAYSNSFQIGLKHTF